MMEESVKSTHATDSRQGSVVLSGEEEEEGEGDDDMFPNVLSLTSSGGSVGINN